MVELIPPRKSDLFYSWKRIYEAIVEGREIRREIDNHVALFDNEQDQEEAEQRVCKAFTRADSKIRARTFLERINRSLGL